MKYPDNNPKTALGMTKVPLHLVPPSAKHYLAMALADGAKKYGPYNWRGAAISVSVYKSACERHLDAFWDGEELAEDSGVHHIAHAMACLALMLDAMTVGKLNDDRPLKGNVGALQAQYASAKSDKLMPDILSGGTVLREPHLRSPLTAAQLDAIVDREMRSAFRDHPPVVIPARPKLAINALTTEAFEASQAECAAWDGKYGLHT